VIVEVGHVLEVSKEHFVFRTDGEMIGLEIGELLIVINIEHSMATAIRAATSERVIFTTLDAIIISFDQNYASVPSYKRVWP